MQHEMLITRKFIDQLPYDVIGAAIEVHKRIGPGLLESIYHKCLKQEFTLRGFRFESELFVGLTYKGVELDTELRCDFLVNDLLVVEIKASDGIAPIYEAQLLTYMKLLSVAKGVIINFNSLNIFRDGQKTLVNKLYR